MNIRIAIELLSAVTVYGRPHREPYKHNPHVNLIGETNHAEYEFTYGAGYYITFGPSESFGDSEAIDRVMIEYVGAAEALLDVLGKANPSDREVELARLRLWSASQRVYYEPEHTYRVVNWTDNP